MVVFAAATAMAFGEIRYPDRPLNLRKSRSPKTAWVGSLYPGQKVKVAFLKNGWVAVFEPGETRNSESAAVGYSNVKYLKTKQTRVEPQSWGELVYTPRKLNVRSKPSVKGKPVDMLSVNERVRIDFPDGDWTMVFSPRATIRSKMNSLGFSSTKYFKPAPQPSVATSQPVPVVTQPVEVASGQGQVSGSVAPPPVQVAPSATVVAKKRTSAPQEWGRVVTVGRKVNLRKGRTSSSRYVRTLKPGEKVRVDFLKSGWYAVFRTNEPLRKESRAIGYALQSLLEDTYADAKTIAPTVIPTAISKAGAVSQSQTAKEPVGGVKKTMVIDRSRFSKSQRPDPTADKTAHGYKYRLLEKSETTKYGESWITLKVFLATSKLPGSKALEDFAKTLWKEHKRANKHVAVFVYLPGMDTEDLAYGVIQFSDEKMLELWVRKATLFGTDFL